VEEVCIEEDKSLLLDGNKNYEMENVGMINDSVIKRNYDKISYLMAVDIGLSKPIFVGKRKGGGKVNNKEGILSGKDELKEKKEEEYKRIEKAVKEVSLDQDEDVNDTSLTTKDSNYEMINTNSAKKRKKSSSSEDNDSPVSDSESEFTVSVNNSNNNSIILDNNSIAIENDFDKSNYFNISSMSFSSIFGETLSLTESRLKSQSKYSSFTTFKVFKFIIKTGEDFLQEQFASQLINVFAQIFKIEKVDIFLYPYEVLSLNHNAGIIEVIPNAITIDELKRKTSISNQLPLKSFYEKYFGVNTPKYKKAIKHFIQSLAGYSLVC
jgi:phosphatidylinositol kinase/protein kinase (PI-3  family)